MDPYDRTQIHKRRLFDFFMYEDGYIVYKNHMHARKKRESNSLRTFVTQVGQMIPEIIPGMEANNSQNESSVSLDDDVHERIKSGI